ncbi:MAG: SDR family NAD(P)-dependent oxidoreductase [Myxococcales bacterium]|jgi:short-subunit dehydrogenase
MKIEGTVMVITGGGNGIGRELVLQSLRRGARVAAVDLREASLQRLQRDAGEDAARLSTHALDVTDEQAVGALPARVEEIHGAVDGLINNAGIIHPFEPIAALDMAAIRRNFDVNFYGTLNMVRAFLPLLQRRPEAHIANLASMGSYLPVPGQSIYCASKAAVKLMTEGLYAELRGTPVGVSVVMPGAIETDIVGNSSTTIPPGAGGASAPVMTSAPRAALAILEGIEAGRLHVYVGADARLMSLAMRAAPKQAIHLIQRQMKKVLALA